PRHWTCPEGTFLGGGSTARGYAGTVSIVQPLIAPLYGGKSAHDVLAAMSDRPERTGYDIVREHWRAAAKASDFDAAWRRWLHDGLIPGTAFPQESISVARALQSAIPNPQSAIRNGLEISFRT